MTPSTRAPSKRALAQRVTATRSIAVRVVEELFRPSQPYPKKRRARIDLAAVLIKTFSADASILLASWLLSSIANWAISALATSVPYRQAALLLPSQGLIAIFCFALPSAWLAADMAKAFSYPQALPFAGLSSVCKKVYEARLYWLLLTFCWAASLLLLCWIATGMLLVSKLILSTVLAIALHRLNQKRLSRPRSIIASGLIFLSLMTFTQVAITARLTLRLIEQKNIPTGLSNRWGLETPREFPPDDNI
ncbi:hypothetical protein [cf. Phormidesmis sp. LEGE 11477]|uniref:hypothetical protein n=1 Tax=cf. Phormidesmis sp. LEGE 11477 TaxID=1828680 RepID=UPI00187EFB33|nr:hypothetical protein [cf. Phormidesmis sp. LEGE 11477]MBE9062472.1 hypothetical protein [cf. Phormidesmis sp. LEGE 11477]